jgi:DNA-binding CsgD family transcriptional regulator
MQNADANNATTELLADVCDSLAIPVALVGGALDLRFANLAARALFERSASLHEHEGRLSFAQESVRQRFQALCDEVIMEVAMLGRPASRMLRIPAPNGCDLDAVVSLRPQWLIGAESPSLLVVIADHARRADAENLLRELNGLTFTESRVVQLLLRGERPASIAELLRVSPETVRSHMKRAFQKCGVHSQSQLVQLVARQLFTLQPFCADSPHPFGGDGARYKIS